MNVVPFLCRMALNLHQKRPSPVTSGRLFHRTIQREIAAPSSVLVGDGAAKLSSLFVIPPHNTMRNRSTIIRFDGDGAAKLPPSSVIPPHNTTRNCGDIICFGVGWCSKVILVIRHSATQYDAKSQHHHSF